MYLSVAGPSQPTIVVEPSTVTESTTIQSNAVEQASPVNNLLLIYIYIYLYILEYAFISLAILLLLNSGCKTCNQKLQHQDPLTLCASSLAEALAL